MAASRHTSGSSSLLDPGTTASPAEAAATVRIDGKLARLILSGNWRLERRTPAIDPMLREALASSPDRLRVDTAAVADWDTALLLTLQRIQRFGRGHGLAVEFEDLPSGVRRLLALAGAVPLREDAVRSAAKEGWLERIGRAALESHSRFGQALAFLGETILALGRLMGGRARLRKEDIAWCLQQCGPEALPIVSLISFLVGAILAFVGSVQLRLFGAEIFVADLVGIGMALEMGALMTAIIMSGRTGASFAAQLGTMQVNEEIDALRSMGISPMEFLVLPRLLALALLMPMLALYAAFMGMLGGATVGILVLHITPVQYYLETVQAVTLNHVGQGVLKSAVFGVIIAITGCLRGIQCGRSAQAVGAATTSAVVSCILYIVIADSIITILLCLRGP